MKFSFKVTVAVTRAEPPREIEASVEGTPLGIVGRMTATSITTLTEVGDETKIDYAIDATLTGKLGSLGQPVLRSKAREMEKQFAARLRAAFAAERSGAMTPFELAEPKTLKEAVGLLDADDPTVRPIAGGTALMLMMKAGVFRPSKLVSLARGQGTDVDRQRQRRTEDRRHDAARGAGALRRGAKHAPVITKRCARCPTSACAMSRPSAARSRMPTRTWTCRRCYRARRAGHGARQIGRAQHSGRRSVRRLFRNRAGEG